MVQFDLQTNAARVAGRIAVVPVLYEHSQDPVAELIHKLSAEDYAQSYIVVPQQVPGLTLTTSGVVGHTVLRAPLRWESIASDELVQAQGCLCCSMRSELSALLGRLFMAVLTRREQKITTVFVMSRSGQADGLKQALEHAPFLAQRYALSGQIQLD